MTHKIKAAFCISFAILMCLPLVIVFGVSLNEKKVLFFPPRGLSGKWYSELFLNPSWFEPLLNSLLVAVLTGIVAISLALPITYILWRNRIFYAKALFGLGLMPFAFPPVISAIGMLLLWVSFKHVGQIENIVLGHTVFLLALPLTMLSLGFESIEDEILEAAQTIGANAKILFTTLIIPMMVPYMFASFAFVFVLSMNEFIISFFLGQSVVVTLPVKLFSSLRGGYSPTIASASVVFIMLSVVIFGLIGKFGDLPKLMGAYGKND